MARIFKTGPTAILRIKRTFLGVTALMLVILWVTGPTQKDENPLGGWWVDIAIWLLISAFFVFYMLRQLRKKIDDLSHHSIGLDDDHLILYDRGLETRVAYADIKKAFFLGPSTNVKVIRLVAGDWLNRDLPIYEDFQTFARLLRKKLPSNVIFTKWPTWFHKRPS